ncbi:hypothetical protein Tco_0674580 [Tanacetum coccineum]
MKPAPNLNDPLRHKEGTYQSDQELDELLSSFQHISDMVNDAQTNNGKKRKIKNKKKKLAVGNNTCDDCSQIRVSQDGDDMVDEEEQSRLVGKQIGIQESKRDSFDSFSIRSLWPRSYVDFVFSSSEGASDCLITL